MQYRAFYFYSDKPMSEIDNPENAESWDGQKMVEFSLDKRIEDYEDSRIDIVKEITAELGRKGNHKSVSLIRIQAGIQKGESFGL